MSGGQTFNECWRPVDLARRHEISTQAVRNYEGEGILPPAERLDSGQRRYGRRHRLALDAFVALAVAAGRQPAARIVSAVTSGQIDTALEMIDKLHAELVAQRRTLAGAMVELDALLRGDLSSGTLGSLELARRLGCSTTTLRNWEIAGIVRPTRARPGAARSFGPAAVRDAELARLLLRNGAALDLVAKAGRAVSTDDGSAARALLQQQLDAVGARSRHLLAAEARLHAYMTEFETL